MTVVMDFQSCMKATLLAIIILSVVAWLSHMYSCIKNFMESLPSAVSVVIAPKCLFVFSNIIVIYLVSESKLSSRRRSKLQKAGDDTAAGDEDMLQDNQKQKEVVLAEVLLPLIIGESKQEQENKMAMVVYEEKDHAPVGNGDVPMLVVMDVDRETCVVNDSARVNQIVLHNVHEVHKEIEEGELELEQGEEMSGHVEQGCTVEDELGQRDLPPADELNRRVEDFIARFNLERQLEEARMPVCCY